MTLAQFDSLVNQYQQDQDMLNYRSALICSVIAEINRDKKKRKKPFTYQDFMPRKEKKLTGDQMMRQAKAITMMLGGEIK